MNLEGKFKVASPNNPKRVSEKMEATLNEQIKVEFNASQLYYAIYAWCEFNGLLGAAKLYKKHSEEERGHMGKVYEYLMDRNCMPKTPSIGSQPTGFKNLRDVVQKAYEHEKYVTSTYNNLSLQSMKEKDMVTFNLANWFLGEQIEEEAKQLNILDKIDFMLKEGCGMLEVDEYLGDLAG